MNEYISEAERIYKNYLPYSPTLAEVELLIGSLACALEWGLKEPKILEKEKPISYFSNLSLDGNLDLISKSLQMRKDCIITSKKKDPCMARSLFCYISSNRHSSVAIGNFLGKDRNTVRFSVDLVKRFLSIKDTDIINMLNLIFDK